MKNKQPSDYREVAKLFHDTYERLAPEFGYETRKDTKQFDPNTPNGKLMIAVCEIVVSSELDRVREETIKKLGLKSDGEIEDEEIIKECKHGKQCIECLADLGRKGLLPV